MVAEDFDNERMRFGSNKGYQCSEELDEIVLDVLGRVANKWTMYVLEVLRANGAQRFTRIGELIGSISQRMLAKTLKQLADDGLVLRTAYPQLPPRVEYELTDLGDSLCSAFCSLWEWAERHETQLQALQSRAAGDDRRKR